MLYLTMHSTHFIYGYMASAAAARARMERVAEHPDSGKEGSALFNDSLNTFYLQSRNIQSWEGRKCFIYRHTQHILFTVIWLRRRLGK